MPTLLILNGFKFFFYANEHPPPHVHIMKGGGWAKVELSGLQVVYSSLKPQEEKAMLKILAEYKNQFLEQWNEWHCR
ncbi:protein of unknown function [Marinospirillum celere]|uniref:DUF4160 domain-containing protein n=1 Tax=Marinospirillum celere TaxID=1122252 RepID=A0A1I1EC97_9GAMM|nr:DUF4160 domain-containing protein [Marinospirillum celere]SFB84192.1 protein of unknown function [Marinospirillum celere]